MMIVNCCLINEKMETYFLKIHLSELSGIREVRVSQKKIISLARGIALILQF